MKALGNAPSIAHTRAVAKPKPPPVDVSAFLQMMDRWPKSWEGVEDDVRVGEQLVALMRPFIVHLGASGLARKTIRRHLDNTWAICGEIIRKVNDDDYDKGERRKWTGERLLLEAVEHDEAPLLYHGTRADQRSCDATARRLHRYLAHRA